MLTALRQRKPMIKGTRCLLCNYEVPACGLSPDDEMAWFERFEGRPCPNCFGIALGMVAGFVLSAVLGKTRLIIRPSSSR